MNWKRQSRWEYMTERRADYEKKLEESLRYIVNVLSAKPEVKLVRLFGSYAKGQRDLLTDLDILVVMETELGFPERLKMLYELLAVPVDLDLLCYTPEEVEDLKESPFLKRILEEGVVLHAKKPD